MTTSERNNITSPPADLIIFNNTTNCFEAYVNATWQPVKCLLGSCGHILTDSRDNQSYQTIQIGTQCWMKQNLNIGNMIKSNIEQSNTGIIKKYCYNDSVKYCGIYGGLYQWNEIMNYDTTQYVQGICPKGWHIPSLKEWKTLTDYLGGDNVAGGKMKETGTAHWKRPNTGATNESGFLGLPGSYLNNISGIFYNLGYYGDWWSSSWYSDTNSWNFELNTYDAKASENSVGKKYGFSVRCLQD